MIRFIHVLGAVCLLAFAFANTAHAIDNRAMLSAVNEIRLAHGLNRLSLDARMQKAAKQQAVLMASRRKMSHSVGWGNSFSSRLKRVGHRGTAAENIARGQRSLSAVLKSWMRSPGHRRNMLNPRMRTVGLSVAKGGGKNYWAMVLGG